MDSKAKILIIILAVGIVSAAGWWVWNNQITPGRLGYERCLKLEAEISEDISSIDNSCEIDSDCKPLNFGGNWVNICVNQNTNTLAVQSAVKNFLKKCPFPGVYPPIECLCVENKCAPIIKESQEVTIATDKTEYEQGETVKIIIRNDLDKEKWIYLPFYTIERFDNGDWIEIKKVDCPCEVACNIAAYFILQPHGVKEYQWDQKETWCSDPTRISQTISNQVPPGKYRIKSEISDVDEHKSKQTIYSSEFTIKEK